LIISCGMPDVRMVSVNQLVEPPVAADEFRGAMVAAFSSVFAVSIERSSLEEVMK